MQFTEQDLQLITLHYIHPVPYNRFHRLLQQDPALEEIGRYSVLELQQLLGLSSEKTRCLMERYSTVSELSLPKLLIENNCFPIPYSHPEYPDRLKQLCDPPAVLYARGDRSLLHAKAAVAVIGSRKATEYSKTALEFIIPPLVDRQVPVISGLAAGADTLAHEAAIQYGGRTIAVLGHGFSHMYPKKNEQIAREIGSKHLLCTEYPPYVPPARWTFPMRNRIISGLSDAVVVTESSERSGTMSTVEHALDHGKEIFAVPGNIHLPLSAGPNKLLDEGARPLWSGYQIIDSLR